MKYDYTGTLKILVDKALNGDPEDVDDIMSELSYEADLVLTRKIDFALSLVATEQGIERIRYYLFNGTLIQWNYACLFLNRIDEWEPVKEAFKQGLIDEIQAYAR